MRDKCAELDAKIRHLDALSVRVTDGQPLEGMAALKARYQSQRRQLHLEDLPT